MARSHLTCDGPACSSRRTRWQALCDRCFSQLSQAGRARLIRTRAARHYAPAEYRAARREAKRELGELRLDDRRPVTRNFISAAQAAAMTARLLGEREEADA